MPSPSHHLPAQSFLEHLLSIFVACTCDSDATRLLIERRAGSCEELLSNRQQRLVGTVHWEDCDGIRHEVSSRILSMDQFSSDDIHIVIAPSSESKSCEATQQRCLLPRLDAPHSAETGQDSLCEVHRKNDVASL